MNQARLQSLIYKGNDKAAVKAGYHCNHYRFNSLINPINSGNLIGEVYAAFSNDRKFLTPNPYTEPIWLCWADGAQLNQFDVLVSNYASFYIGSIQPLLPIQCIQTNHNVTIKRTGYSTSGPLKQSLETIATNLPCFLISKKVDVKSPEFDSRTAGESISRWSLFLPAPNNSIRKGDTVIDENNNKYIIDTPDFTDIGYVCTIRLAAP